MGARHNRKRTRSRPRNRPISISSTASDTSDISTSSLPFQHVAPQHQMRADQWLDRAHHKEIQRRKREDYEAYAAKEERLRIFGGEPDDDDELIFPMMKVVTDLFGALDFEDP